MPGLKEFSVQEILNRSFDPTNNWLRVNDAEAVRRILLNGTLMAPLLAPWTIAVTGSGTFTAYPGYLYVTTGTTTGSTGRAYTTDLPFPGATYPVDFSKRILWGFLVQRVTSDTNVIARIQLKAATTEGALAARGLGIRMANLTMTGEGYDSAGAFTGTIQTMTTGVSYSILVDHEPAIPRIRFYVNGVLQATQTTATAVPGTITPAAGIVVSVLNGAGTANGIVTISAPWIYQAF